jgi:putative redox protein
VRAVARRRSGFTHDVEIEGGHSLVIDEPRGAGGGDAGPSPTRTVAAALAACTAITCEMYAERKGWELGEVEVEVEVEYGRNSSIDHLTLVLRVPEPLDEGQQERLLAIAARCPVHRALAGAPPVAITDRIECRTPAP